ncbi:MAG TPA: condensation domain-containing protein [Acidobacteriota bacterium]|nr:condensation domain-containing protein [Acidobacteriota bacterium]
MQQYLRRIQSLSPDQRSKLNQKLSDWRASQAKSEKSLALFYVPQGRLSPEEVRDFLEARVPDHMLPSEFVELERLPRTANGKIDRQALLKMDGGPLPAEHSKVAAPSTVTERRMAEIWKKVLHRPQVNADDNFFQLGGHSLLATQVIMEIEQALGLQVPLNTIFKHRTLSKLSAYLDQLPRPGGDSEEVSREVPAEGIPLSNAQRRLWYISQVSEGGLEYKIVKVLNMEGRLNVAAVSQGLCAVAHRHEALRTCFGYVSGKLVQKVLPSESVSVDHVDLSGLSAESAEETFRRLEEEVLLSPFDLEKGPLIRMILVKYDDTRARLIFDAHHIVIDGWSVGILVKELNSFFRSFSHGLPSRMSPLSTQYRHYAAKEKERLDAKELDRQLTYWRGKLGGMPPLEFKRSRLSQSGPGPDGEIDFELPDGLQERIAKICAELQITPFMFLTSVYYLLLYIHTGSRDIAIGTDVANRDSKAHAELIGFFVNQLVIRLTAQEHFSFRQLCQSTRDCVEEAFAHKDVPYDALVRELRSSESRRDSLFRAKFVFHHSIPDIAIGGIETSFIEVKPRMGKFDLLLNVEERDDGLTGKFEYSGAVFDEPAVARMITHFRQLCQNAAADVEASLQALANQVTAADAERSRRHLEVAREGRRRDLRNFLQSRNRRVSNTSA